MVCCTFLLQLVNETLDPTSSVHKQVGVSISMDDNSELIDDIKQQLLAQGGRDQLLLFFTGPAGAGKTTAIKAAEWFCFEFIHHATSYARIHHSSTQLTQVQVHPHLEEEL